MNPNDNIINFTPLPVSAASIFRRIRNHSIAAPGNLSIIAIPGGNRITFTDSITPLAVVELEGKVDSGDYALLATIARGVQYYDDLREPGVTMTYRARARVD